MQGPDYRGAWVLFALLVVVGLGLGAALHSLAQHIDVSLDVSWKDSP